MLNEALINVPAAISTISTPLPPSSSLSSLSSHHNVVSHSKSQTTNNIKHVEWLSATGSCSIVILVLSALITILIGTIMTCSSLLPSRHTCVLFVVWYIYRKWYRISIGAGISSILRPTNQCNSTCLFGYCHTRRDARVPFVHSFIFKHVLACTLLFYYRYKYATVLGGKGSTINIVLQPLRFC
jgi:hypothetical protein